MADTEHKSFFSTHKVIAFLPLLLMGAGVWYYVHGRLLHRGTEQPAAQTGKIFGAAPAPAAAPEAPASAAATAAGGGAAAARQEEVYDPKAGIDIQGSTEFKNQVTHALKLVWMADRETFLFLKKNLYVIRNETQTGFYMEEGRPVLAHQGWHAWYTLTKKKKSRIAPPLPGEKDERVMDINPARFDYKGLDAILYIENKASDFQLEVLKKVGAPARETGRVARRGKRNFEHAHDGNYAINP